MIPFETFAAKTLADAHAAALAAAQRKAEQYLLGILNDEAMLDALKRVNDRRFLELVHREDKVEAWVAHVEHERKRSGSAWNHDRLESFADRLKTWSASLQSGSLAERKQDPAVAELARQASRIGLTSEDAWTPEVCADVGRAVFRKALWRLWNGGRS
jgi:hypothetical protein